MIRHIFTTAVKSKTTDEQIDEIITALRSLNGKIIGMSNLIAGKNLSWYDHKAQIVVCADFVSKESWEIYMQYPEHMQIGKKYLHLFDEESMFVSQVEI